VLPQSVHVIGTFVQRRQFVVFLTVSRRALHALQASRLIRWLLVHGSGGTRAFGAMTHTVDMVKMRSGRNQTHVPVVQWLMCVIAAFAFTHRSAHP
jgi:hypothetical protein